jgi:2,3-diaminopropionate biosynthesis protein SbnA
MRIATPHKPQKIGLNWISREGICMESLLMDARTITELTPNYLRGLVDSIGNTPVEPVYFVIKGKVRKVYLKLEGANPAGSVKDRTGYALVQDLEQRGLLHEDSIVIESTSGNLGVALAFICRAKGYPFLAIIDPKTTAENLARMLALGARVELVNEPDAGGGYLLSRLERVQSYLRLSNRYIWTDQYANTANPSIHYTATGPEIYWQLHGKVDAVFAAVSTGGTLAGIGRFFRKARPTTRVIGVDARGSVIFGTPPGPRKLTGIGSSRRSSFLSKDIYDTHLLVGDEEAFAFCHALYAATGIKVGGSSGAVLAACTSYLADHPKMEHVVCLCSDTGENYTSSIYNDGWLQQHGIHLSQHHLGPVQDILSGKYRRA